MPVIDVPADLAAAIDTWAAGRSLHRNEAAEHLLAHALKTGGPRIPPEGLKARIFDSWAKRTGGRRTWVSLVNLRADIADVDQDVLTETMRAMHVADVISLIPEENRRAITPADRQAAVRIGNEDRHLFVWNGKFWP